MAFTKNLLMRAFGCPPSFLGRLGGVLMARTNRTIARRAIELPNVGSSDSVLKVGFGPGVGIELLARPAPSGRVVGIDPSDKMVDQTTGINANVLELAW